VLLEELQVNGVVEKAYNKLTAGVMEIVKCHSIGGTEEYEEKYHSLFFVFMNIL
jgi:hypothetical protein